MLEHKLNLNHNCYGTVIKLDDKYVHNPELEEYEVDEYEVKDFIYELLNKMSKPERKRLLDELYYDIIYNLSREDLSDILDYYIETHCKEENAHQCDECGEWCYTKQMEVKF